MLVKRSIVVLSIVFSMNHVFVVGMHEFLNPKVMASDITNEIKGARQILAIACTPTGTLIVLDDHYCTFWSYKETKLFRVVSTGLKPCEAFVNKIYAHPRKDISIIPKNEGNKHTLYNHEDNSFVQLDCFKNKNSNVLYSNIAGFYVIKDKCLVYDNTIWPARFNCGSDDFSPGLLFAFLDLEESCFLCCDQQEKSLYKLYTYRENAEKLFNFDVRLDLTNWIYNPVEKTIYAVTQDDRRLYAAYIETKQQKVLPKISDFKIGGLALANDRVLVLLSQENKLCYIDVKNMHPLIITSHSIYLKNDKQSTVQGQKIAVFPNGEEIIIACSDKCLGIKIPLWIREFNAYEKYREISCLTIFPQELQRLIAINVHELYSRDKKDMKKYHEIE